MFSVVIAMLPIMIFLHIVDDFYLQGVLANMKQVEWWDLQCRDMPKKRVKLYSNDWMMALTAHSFSWSFMVNLPILIYVLCMCRDSNNGIIFYLFMLVANMLVHYGVDNEKCNSYTINLIIDQAIHLAQIVVTWIAFVTLIYLGRIEF